jgi:exonuclease SbcD
MSKSLKVLHTGDLHLGLSLRKISREDEQQKMLDWLVSVIQREEIDVLLIAGDVFDVANPPTVAREMFFNFLEQLVDVPTLDHVVITAGNHDSAGQLNALCPVTRRLGIHILGGITNRDETWNDWIIPIQIDGEVKAVVNAIPYISEYRLGIRWTSNQVGRSLAVIRDALRSVYEEMAAEAKVRYGDVPLIAMGHLTAMDEQYNLGEMPRSIHRIIDKGLDGEIFGDQYTYVALGHIHRKYKVRGTANAWYCGSPMPCSISEAEDGSSRGVWLFELNGDPTERPLPRAELSPTWRQLIRWQGKEADMEDYLRSLTWPAEQLPPFLYLEVETASSSRVNQTFNDVINTLAQEGLPTPLKGKLDSKRTQQAIQDADEYDLCDPDALLRPLDLFQDFVRFKEGVDATPEQIKYFAELLSGTEG